MSQPSFPKLGRDILVVLDCEDACLHMLGQVVRNLSDIENRRLTLVHHVPTICWEHGGDPSQEARTSLKEEASQVWQAEEQLRSRTEHYFDKACTVMLSSRT